MFTADPLNSGIIYHEVENSEVNRLDLIADKYLGSAQYSWVIAYFNNISDGFSCNTGQKLMIPTSKINIYYLYPINPIFLTTS